jgi:protein-disulfide isomerase
MAWDHSAAAIPIDKADPSWGRPDAPVTIVEFVDLECPFCSRVGPTLARITETYGPSRVRVVLLHNPLPFHPQSHAAAVAASTVYGLAGSDALSRFVDLVFAHQADLSDDKYETWALASGVEAQAYRDAIKSQRFAPKVDADMALAKRIGATGTPAFRINGINLEGAQPYEKFAELIDQQLAAADGLVKQGTRPLDVYVKLTNRNFAAPPSNPPEDKPDEDLSVWKIPVLADDPVLGLTDASVTMVVFSDFECPFCSRVEGTLKQLRDRYKNELRIVWKDNPLGFHKNAMPAAVLGRLVLERRGNASFWTLHDKIFEAHPDLTSAELQELAEQYKVPWTDVQAAVDKSRQKSRIEASVELASDFDAQGTPNFFVNGVRISGAQPAEKFQHVIDAELEKAKALLKSGVPRSRLYQELTKVGKQPPPPERKDAPAPRAGRPALGPANAAVTIQEWSDFQCPFCGRVQPTLVALRKEFPNQLRLVWRHLPLPFHAQAPLAAEAAEEVFAQKGNAAFWAYHDKIFAVQAEPNGLSEQSLEKMAVELGVDAVRFRAALDAHKHRAALDADLDIAKGIDISGTPAFVVNGYFVSGAQPLESFRRVIRRALDDKKGTRK